MNKIIGGLLIFVVFLLLYCIMGLITDWEFALGFIAVILGCFLIAILVWIAIYFFTK